MNPAFCVPKIVADYRCQPASDGQKSARTATSVRTEVNTEIMKTIKFLTLLALTAAALSALSACEAKTSAGSSGVSASATTTKTSK